MQCRLVQPDASTRSTSASRIVLAGLGLITPLGLGAWPTFAALLQGRRLTDRLAGLEIDTQPVPLVQAIGGVSVARHGRIDPTVELAERAAREALAEAGVAATNLPTFLGTSKGAVVALQREAAEWLAAGGAACAGGSGEASGEASGGTSGGGAVALGPHGYLSHHVRLRTGLRVMRHTVAACASSLVALDQARRFLLHQSEDDAVLVLTAEAALTPLFVHSYRRLGVLAPLTVERYNAAPLDGSRQGFVLAEVGAAVLLRRLPAGEAPAAGQIELLDTATACEASDLVRPSASMDALRHVAESLLAGRQVAALHPHAPGTAAHDPLELAILAQAAGADAASPLPVYAHKGALGHTLGSAGLVSLVLAALTMRTSRLPPMSWLRDPLVQQGLRLEAGGCTLERTPAAGVHGIFAAGFGGHVAGAVLGPAIG